MNFMDQLGPIAKLFWAPSKLDPKYNSWLKPGYKDFRRVHGGKCTTYISSNDRKGGAVEICWNPENSQSSRECYPLLLADIQEFLLTYLKEPYLSQYKEEIIINL